MIMMISESGSSNGGVDVGVGGGGVIMLAVMMRCGD